MKRLGERIKRRRESMQLQLNDLAKQVGISSSALSQIENAKAFPSIFNLKAIADCLNTTVGEIIGEHDILSRNPVIRKKDKKFVKENKSGTRLYLISQHDPLKKMETFSVVFTDGSDAEDIMVHHPGQEFIYILNGAINVLLDDKTYDLTSGDSCYFNAGISHQVKNINNGSTELIWVVAAH